MINFIQKYPWWYQFEVEHNQSVTMSYTPSNGIKIGMSDMYNNELIYSEAFLNAEQARVMAERLNRWADMYDKNDYYSHEEKDIPMYNEIGGVK